jgi:hypothetical protein
VASSGHSPPQEVTLAQRIGAVSAVPPAAGDLPGRCCAASFGRAAWPGSARRLQGDIGGVCGGDPWRRAHSFLPLRIFCFRGLSSPNGGAERGCRGGSTRTRNPTGSQRGHSLQRWRASWSSTLASARLSWRGWLHRVVPFREKVLCSALHPPLPLLNLLQLMFKTRYSAFCSLRCGEGKYHPALLGGGGRLSNTFPRSCLLCPHRINFAIAPVFKA